MKKYFELFLVFFKIGMFTIGGGYAMIPIIQKALVEEKKWITDDEFMDSLALAQAAPGVLAVNTSIVVGYKIMGKMGMLVSALGASLPSFIIILIIAMSFREIKDSPMVIAFFKGVKPAVAGLIFVPVVSMSKKVKLNRKTFIIPLIVGLSIAYLNFSPIFFIGAGIVGANIYYFGGKEE